MNGARPLPFQPYEGPKTVCRTAVLARSVAYWPGVPRSAALAAAWLVALAFSMTAAHAEFRVCNNTRSLINLAIGSLVGRRLCDRGLVDGDAGLVRDADP